MSLTRARRTTTRPATLASRVVPEKSGAERSMRTSFESTGSAAPAGRPMTEPILTKLTASDAPAALRRAVLRALDRHGRLTSAELPHQWPVTRQHVRAVLRDLMSSGLVDVTSGIGGLRRFRLTELGRTCLERIDWSEAVELELRA